MNKDLEMTVDQPIAGHYYWAIVWLGHAGDVPRVVDYARGPMPTRGAATATGLAALLRHQEAIGDIAQPTHGMHADPFVERVRCVLH